MAFTNKRIVKGVYDPESNRTPNPARALDDLKKRLKEMGLESIIKGDKIEAKDSRLNVRAKAYFCGNSNGYGKSEGKAEMQYSIDSPGKGKKTSKRIGVIKNFFNSYTGPHTNKSSD